MMYSKWRGLCGILSLAGSLTLLGCGVNGNSYVRVVNASPGLANYTVIAGQTPIVSALPYGTEGVQQQGQYATTDTSGNYRPLGAGTKQPLYVLVPPNTKIAPTTQTFVKNTPYTIVLESTALEFQVLADNTAPSGGGLRVLDVSTVSGPVDVYLTAAGAPVSGSPIVGNMTYQQVTNPYLPPVSGSLEVQVTSAGNPSKVLAIFPYTFVSGKTYTIFFMDPPMPTGNIDAPNGTGTNKYVVLVTNDPAL